MQESFKCHTLLYNISLGHRVKPHKKDHSFIGLIFLKKKRSRQKEINTENMQETFFLTKMVDDWVSGRL